ncbi:MAG: lysylphosphatidylglycerol synthase transmembrane domain-containing protein [Chloroflexota bacterium]
MSPDLRRKLIWSLMFGLLIYIGFIFFGDVQKLAALLNEWPWLWLPLVLGLTLVNYVGRLLKWQWYLNLLNIPISSYDSGRIFGVGMLMVMTPGKAGEFLKSYMVKNVSDTPMAVTAPVVLAERITDGIAMLLLASVGLIVFPHPVARTVAILSAIAFTVFIGVIQSRSLSMRCLEIGQKLPVINKLAAKLYQFYESSYTIFRPGNLLISLGIGLISWLSEGLAYFVVLVGFGQPFTMETALIAIFIFSISVVIGAVLATPGGLGGVEGSLQGFSTQLLNMDGSTAIAAALLIRFCTLWFGVFIGVVSFFLWPDLLAGSAEAQQSPQAAGGD